MSIKLMNLVWSDNTGRLNGIEAAILLKMADHAADDGSSIYPSLSTLCKTTKFSKTSVVRGIKSLVNKGFLIIFRPGRALHQTTIYKIDVSILECPSKSMKKPKVIHKKSVYKMNYILRGHSHCTLRGYSHCTLRGSPSPLITTMYKGTNTVGFNKPVDNPTFPKGIDNRKSILARNGRLKRLEVAKKLPTPEQALLIVNFLLDCKKDGMDVKKYSHERYRGLVDDHYLDRLAA